MEFSNVWTISSMIFCRKKAQGLTNGWARKNVWPECLSQISEPINFTFIVPQSHYCKSHTMLWGQGGEGGSFISPTAELSFPRPTQCAPTDGSAIINLFQSTLKASQSTIINLTTIYPRAKTPQVTVAGIEPRLPGQQVIIHYAMASHPRILFLSLSNHRLVLLDGFNPHY